MKEVVSPTPSIPQALYVWLVPSEHVQEQPGSWRIRKWDTAPFPEANYTLSASSETAPTADYYHQSGKACAPSAILPNDSTSIPSQRLASSEARPGTTTDEPANGETHRRLVAPRSGSGEGVSQADGGERPALPSCSTPDKSRRLSQIALERYEALYEAELYREKDTPMWGSEHQAAARKVVYQAVIDECSAPSARNANAERYEWLRSHSWVDISLIKSVLNFGPGYQQTKPEILDAAIDAELSRSDGGTAEQRSDALNQLSGPGIYKT